MLNFDVIHFLKLDFVPGVCEFVSKVSSFTPILAVAELPPIATEDEETGEQAEAPEPA